MYRQLLTCLPLLLLSPALAQAGAIPGMNSVETKCISSTDTQIDPIKEPGVYPSAHMHTHYGFTPDQNTNTKIFADAVQNEAAIPFVQNIPGGGPSTVRDPGWGPFISTCMSYGDWAWYAIPTPMNNDRTGDPNRGWIWLDREGHPRTVGVMTLTWAAPIGVPVYEIPFGAAMIIGDSHAMSEAEMDHEHIYFTCGDLVTKSNAPRDCSDGAPPPRPPLSTLLYQAAASAAMVSKTALDTAITGGNLTAINAAIDDLAAKVTAMQTQVTALKTAANAPVVGGGGTTTTPTEWSPTGLVTAVVVFPNCWDGQNGYPNFDSQWGIDRKHFYFSTNGSCGSGVMITQLFMSVNFGDLDTKKPMTNPFNPDGTYKLKFSSGEYYTLHSDFGNMWDGGLGYFTAGCLNHTDYYGGYGKLNTWFNACNIGNANMSRCPAASPPGFEVFAPEGVFICKNQD